MNEMRVCIESLPTVSEEIRSAWFTLPIVIQRATGTVRHDLSNKKASDPRSDPRATCGMVALP